MRTIFLGKIGKNELISSRRYEYDKKCDQLVSKYRFIQGSFMQVSNVCQWVIFWYQVFEVTAILFIFIVYYVTVRSVLNQLKLFFFHFESL